MDKILPLTALTKKQREIIEATNSIIYMPRGTGKTIGCISGAFAFCRGNEHINICVSTKYSGSFVDVINSMDDLDNIETVESENGFIIYFKDTDSKLVISKFSNDNILYPDNSFKSYSYLPFVYSVIYFDDVLPEDIFLNDKITSPYCMSYREKVLNYLDSCVKDRYIFVH